MNIVTGLVAGLALAAAGAAHAQILIGQTAGFTGAVAAGVTEATDGAMLYLDAVNASGGIHGQPVQVIGLDDQFDPKRAAENARTLITEKNVVALFLTRGTPHNQAILPLLAEYKVPLIGPSTGAMLLHRPVNPWVFNVRATYQREAERAVAHLQTIGMDRIAIVHVDDSFGADATEGAMKGFAAAGRKPLFVARYKREKWDFSTIAPRVAKENVQALIFLGSGSAVADGVAALHAAGSKAQVVTLSNNASGGFVKSLKAHARGVIVSQVFPNERSMSAAIVKEAHDLAVAKGMDGVSPAMLEGFAAAKVLVLGLRRAGPNPTRAKVQQALDRLGTVDLGGLELSYSPTDHTGLDFVDLSIIGADGKFRR